MDDEDFNGIAAGLKDAIAYVGGDETRARVAAGPNVRAIRKGIKLTQDAFAKAYHIPVGTVRDWEQGRRHPDAPARVLLSLIEVDPTAVEKLIARAAVA